MTAAWRLLVSGVWQLLCWAPLGLLAAVVLPDAERRVPRLFKVALPAAGLALTLAGVVLSARAGFTLPGPFEFILPAIGILLGVWAGLAWRRGWWARVLFVPKLAALALVVVLAALGLATLAIDAEPSLPESPSLSSAARRQLARHFRGKDPRTIPPGEVRTIRLSAPEVDQLASWVAAVGADARATARLIDGGVAGTASVQVPGLGRWLNLSGSVLVAIDKGRLTVGDPRLRVGRLTIPEVVLDALSPLVVAGVKGDRDLRRLLPAVESLSLGEREASLTYGRMEIPRGLVARLVWGEEASQAMAAAVGTQIDRLLDVLPAAPEGDARFGVALEAAFALARARSAGTSAVDENRAALLALGIVLGHQRLAQAAGQQLRPGEYARMSQVRGQTSVRGRRDWTRHFTVSSALTVLSSVSPSNAAGLLKEELDADGGSGFSFGDLLADRAGTTFAEVATRDEASAAAMQERLAQGFRLADFFPAADDLPEGIPDDELQSRYGGVGGPLYRRYADEIERRLLACAAYRGRLE